MIKEFNYKEKDRKYISIFFNSKEFNITTCGAKHLERTEILPGIFVTIKENFFYLKDYELNLKGLVAFIISRFVKTKIILEIENNRDDIILYEDRKLIYKNIAIDQDELNITYNSSRQEILKENVETIDLEKKYSRYASREIVEEKKNCKIQEKENVEVKVSQIMYPFTPGGGANRCYIQGIFYELDLIENSIYKFFTKHEMYNSVKESNFEKYCNKTCKHILEKFKSGKYEYVEDDSDEIRLNYINGIYKIQNANHRCCAAKLVNAKTLKATVTYDSDLQDKNYTYSKLKENERSSREKNNVAITEFFYNKIEELGLKKEDGRYILLKGLRGADLVKFIEAKSSKTIANMYEEHLLWRSHAKQF